MNDLWLRTRSSTSKLRWMVPRRTLVTTRRPSRVSKYKTRNSLHSLPVRPRDVTPLVMPPSGPANELAIQNDEQRIALESAKRGQKTAEADKLEATDRLVDLQDMYNTASSAKRSAENDFHALQGEVDELENSAKSAEEKAARAGAEVAKLLAELANVTDGASNAERSRAALAKQNADMAVRLEEAEAGGSRSIKAQMRKLENRIAELESDLDTEARKSANVIKS